MRYGLFDLYKCYTDLAKLVDPIYNPPANLGLRGWIRPEFRECTFRIGDTASNSTK